MSETAPRPLWAFCPLEDYEAPAAAPAARLGERVRSLWRRFRQPDLDPSASDRQELAPLPGDLLDRVAPPPDWKGAVEALDSVVKERLESKGRNAFGAVAVVGPAGGPADEIVAAWATAEGWSVVRPPEPGSLLEPQTHGIERAIDGAEEGLAIPSLDALYLRHHDGLRILGSLLEHLAASTERPTVIGCGSFGWAYLARVMSLESLIGPAVTLEAFDERRLGEWLSRLDERDGERLAVGEAGSRKTVLPLTEDRSSGERDGEPSDFLQRLAVYSRGHPNVAWSIWRQALRSAAASDPRSDGQGGRSLTVPAWSDLELPSAPADLSQDDLFVLHALLLHRALPAELLSAILPASAASVSKSLRRLCAGGLVSGRDGRWSVSPAGYPAVRDALFESGYLVGEM